MYVSSLKAFVEGFEFDGLGVAKPHAADRKVVRSKSTQYPSCTVCAPPWTNWHMDTRRRSVASIRGFVRTRQASGEGRDRSVRDATGHRRRKGTAQCPPDEFPRSGHLGHKPTPRALSPID